MEWAPLPDMMAGFVGEDAADGAVEQGGAPVMPREGGVGLIYFLSTGTGSTWQLCLFV